MPELQQPGYLHVLLNHLPIIGTAMGALALLIGLALRSRKALLPGLVIVLVSGISAWPVYETGSAAYRPIRKIADDPGSDWLDEHMDRADRTVWTFYAMAGIAGVAIFVPLRWPRTAVSLSVASTLAAVICTGVAGYIAQPGGLVRHTEFRPPAAPGPTLHDHEHQ